MNTLEKRKAEKVGLNEIAQVEVALEKTVAFDTYDKIQGTGSFIIIDRLTNVTIGAGMITSAANEDFDNRPVSALEKARRFNQLPAIVSLVGDNATEVANGLDRRLFELGRVAAISTAFNAPFLKTQAWSCW